MTLKSMTGFSREDGQSGAVSWYWELRGVNGRGLDIRLRLPSGYERLDQPARKAVSDVLSRGNITAQLTVQRTSGDVEIQLNEAALQQVLRAAERVQEMTECAPPRVEGLLQVRGVLEVVEPQDDAASVEVRDAAILVSLKGALAAMIDARVQEGAQLQAAMSRALDEMAQVVDDIAGLPSRTLEAMAERLRGQIRKLLDDADTIDPQRLYQEAVMLAGKADIEEELQRLRAHIFAARELLESNGPAGRKLDFLTQEFNREANTICSKANDIELTQRGLALKALIDQMREQVQNIE